MRIIDITHPPQSLWIGREGENTFRPVSFECANWFSAYPNATIAAYYQPYGVSDPYPLVLTVDGTKRIWHPLLAELVKGDGELQIVLMNGDTVGTSAIIPTKVDRSLISSADHPADEAPSWPIQVVRDVTEQADRAEEASEHYPKIINGVWYVWSVQDEDYVSTGIEAQGEDGYSPTFTVTEIEGGHRVTITDVDGAHTFDVMDGEDSSGGSATVIVTIDESADPMTASMTAAEIKAAADNGERVVLSVSGYEIPYATYIGNTVVFSEVINIDTPSPVCMTIYVNSEKHVLPSMTYLAQTSDIPTQQQMAAAAPVQSVNGMTGAVTIPIPSVPQMATAADMSDWTSGKTVDAGVLKADFQLTLALLATKANIDDIPTEVSDLTNDSGYQTAAQVQSAIAAAAELPTVTSSDNGKFLRVVNGAWAAQAVPSAESNSFGGGA